MTTPVRGVRMTGQCGGFPMNRKGARMTIEIRGVHYEITDDDRDLIDKKMEKISFAEEHLVSVHLAIIKEKAGFKFEATVHFRWGNQLFLHVNDFEIHEGLDKLFKKISVSVTKEKEKIKEHKPAAD
jgi:putative sigma-54 modulation protein